MTRVRIEAPAKLTLSLRITGVRPDGYHLIDAEMVSLALHDLVTITPGDGLSTSITVDGPFADGVPTDGSNLVSRALALTGRGAHVHVTKNIPHGGGLGGGSTDAAAVLRWAQFADRARAAAVGADIPFCMTGGRARVRGIGELVEHLPPIVSTITLIVPPVHVSTPAVYRAWDDLGGPSHESGNDLEPAAIAVAPELADWKRRIEDATGRVPTLAGSGATWFLNGDHGEIITSLQNATVVVTSTRPDAGLISPA